VVEGYQSKDGAAEPTLARLCSLTAESCSRAPRLLVLRSNGQAKYITGKGSLLESD
jgi:hypothetical protein